VSSRNTSNVPGRWQPGRCGRAAQFPGRDADCFIARRASAQS